MTGEQLRSMRVGAGLNQPDGAAALGIPLGTLQRYERGQADVPDEVADMAAAAFFGTGIERDGEDGITTVALGEALMLTEQQRDQLYERVRRTLVAEAIARVVRARVEDTLSAALARREDELARANRALAARGEQTRGR